MAAPRVLVLECAAQSWGSECLGYLSQAERERAEAFVRPVRRGQFIAGRLVLRALLADVSPRPVPVHLLERPPLPPQVLEPRGWQVSLSHSGDWVAAAISEAPLGVDIEDTRISRDSLALADFALPHEQANWLRTLPDPRRDFYRLWTLHECLLKLPAEARPAAISMADGPPALPPDCGRQWWCRDLGPATLSIVAAHADATRLECISLEALEQKLARAERPFSRPLIS